MAGPPEKSTAVPHCRVCAQPAKTLKCSKCKTPYCSRACQTLDWKERGHKATCKRLVKAAASRGEAPTPPPSPEPKAAPPVVDGPARGRADVARAKAAAAAADTTTAAAPEPEHWHGSTRCPVCLEDWDVNAGTTIMICCCKTVCSSCNEKLGKDVCPLCRTPNPKSNDEVLAMLRRHVENDNPAAIRQLGMCYTQGDLGLVPSHKKAARLFQRAADLGDVLAMFNLGNHYCDGRGVKLDEKKAAEYYRMAADRGHANAQYNLGCSFQNGDGVAQDDAEAVRFFKLAADQGHTEAEHNLGAMYAHGRGVARDVAEAVRWLKRAAAKGASPPRPR